MTSAQCVFCHLPRERVVADNEHAMLIADAFPVSPGHSLVIPKRHMVSFFDASAAKREAMFTLLEIARAALLRTHRPDGFNVGINDGAAAGQTAPHLHMHLIPRYQGDQADPRGGVRWVMPDNADYWSQRYGRRRASLATRCQLAVLQRSRSRSARVGRGKHA